MTTRRLAAILAADVVGFSSMKEQEGAVRAAVGALLSSDMRMTRERSEARHGFTVSRSSIRGRVFIPKYYDPTIAQEMAGYAASSGAPWITIAQLVADGLLSVWTGVEVGKMAYGTGNIPFIRTTDIAELEVKADPRQGVSREVYSRYERKAALEPGDVVLIRDGTYLVGSSALAAESDTPALVCGGIYRLRSRDPDRLSPGTLLGLLNLPVVRRQMGSKQSTRDVIDTLGKRLFEVQVPDPRSEAARRLGASLTLRMGEKAKLRAQIGTTVQSIEPLVPRKAQNRPGWSMRG